MAKQEEESEPKTKLPKKASGSGSELLPADLREYAVRMREVFGIEEDLPINFSLIEAMPEEIERRRALVRCFIPDVFAAGKYDKRADVIDGCIYLLEQIKEKGSQALIIRALWQKRVKIGRDYSYGDLELGRYGYGYDSYHPIHQVLGYFGSPEPHITRLVRRLKSFKGKRTKIDLNLHAVIVFGSFASTIPGKIDPQMVEMFNVLHKKFAERPLGERINTTKYLIGEGYNKGAVLKTLARLNAFTMVVQPRFERSVFGLDMYRILLPFPHLVQLKFPPGVVIPALSTAGRDIYQDIHLSIPEGVALQNWFDQFPPQTQILKIKHIRAPVHSLLESFDVKRQDWAIPWADIPQMWRNYLESLNQTDRPVKLNYGRLTPSTELLEVANLVEHMGNTKNSDLWREVFPRIKKPKKTQDEEVNEARKKQWELDKKKRLQGKPQAVERIKEKRIDLDNKALAFRRLILLHSGLDDFTTVILGGDEFWKLNLLTKIAEVFPAPALFLGENVRTKERYLLAEFVHTEHHSNQFMSAFDEAFHGEFKYVMFKKVFFMRYMKSWVETLWNKKARTWAWNPKDYRIAWIPRRRK